MTGFHHVDLQPFARQLRQAVPGLDILDDPEDTRPFECDSLTTHRCVPGLVLMPTNEADIVAILRCCTEAHVPVVARGAGTGLSGGALPLAHGVLLSMARMNRIASLDAMARTATVQPGVTNLAISQAAAVHQLYYAPDPSSQIACTIGGNVAENSGGVHCLKYGLTVNNVLRLRVVLMDGEVLEIGSEALDSPGFDLLALMIGSEGLLGIVTEVTVRLLPKPQLARVILAAFASVEQAGQAVAGLIAAGSIPAGLEMMDHDATQAAEAFVHVGYPTDAAAILLCEADGNEAEVSDDIERMSALLQAYGATSLRVSTTEAERLRLWAGRKGAFPAVGRISPDYYCMDGTIPRKTLAQVLTRIADLSRTYGLRCVNVFHAGDGNLHPLILFDVAKPGELARAEAFGSAILALCVAVGGTVTGEHGVGVEKLDAMCGQFGVRELGLFHDIKHAFDPDELLNPGKAVPTLHRCAELGAMHVHHGQLPHSDLPRF
ncbi:FAD-linked oxidase C-terminal domain-containing protein [Chitinivorax sp. B]|uniref:FAD-linked oxidase C-terminal domain-containing protein n=1 Tax=Chitinivorax sp. B TaxID=2502235 RepID=UPI0010F58E9A|nr:FAD-linked oxidase C-terminal domain-containing protein [Chitinivorax sp. B]